MLIKQYTEEDSERWDDFCNQAHNATFLHTRSFVSYHGSRFEDRSLIIEDEKKKVHGLFLAAQTCDEENIIISHPGITYGGLITDSSMYGDKVISIMEEITAYYRELGYQKLLYKVVPYIYHKVPSQDDIYAIYRLGGKRYRCDLSATIDLLNRAKISSRRKRSLKKACKAGVKVELDEMHAATVWEVLQDNLARKHGATAVHTLDEINLLINRFPENIDIMAAIFDDEVIAGLVLFQTDNVTHAQYIASSEIGHEMSALDLLFETAIDNATQNGKRYFDFGISNEQAGLVLNQSLYKFKHEFGAGGVAHEFYEIGLIEG